MGSVLVLSPRMKSFSPICLSLFVVTTVCLASAASDNLEALSDIADVNIGSSVSQRNPKLFFVSSSTTTTTISSLCYTSTAALTECTGKRRRSISDTAEDSLDINRSGITPANKVDSSFKEPESSGEREGRFLLYWVTTTTTTTSYSATSSLVLACTPAGFTLAVCG